VAVPDAALLIAPEPYGALLVSYSIALSPACQCNGVSEGMALGLVMLDRNELPFTNKMRIALPSTEPGDWPDRYKSQFKQVSTDLSQVSEISA
jgi:hypothetical protein